MKVDMPRCGVLTAYVGEEALSMLRSGTMSGYVSVAVGALSLILNAGSAMRQSCSGQWLPVPAGFDKDIWAMNPYQGELVVAGSFDTAPGAAAKNLGRWNGAGWSSMNGDTLYSIRALRVHEGNLFAGGWFSTPFAPATAIAQWNGASWQALAAPIPYTGPSPWVKALGAYQGKLFIGGDIQLTTSPSRDGGLLWDGAQWESLGAVFGLGSITATAVYQGDLYVAGLGLRLGSSSSSGSVLKYDGTTWSKIGEYGIEGNSDQTLCVYQGKLYIGSSSLFDNRLLSYGPLATWDGTALARVGTIGNGVNIVAMTEYHGDLVLGGSFVNAFGVGANGVVRWNGSSFATLGSGISGVSAAGRTVNCLAVVHDELVAGGGFTTAGGMSSPYFARWADEPRAWTAVQPESRPVNEGLTLALSAAAASGYSDVSYQWKRDGVDVLNGAGGASAGGGTVSGASGLLASPTDGSAITLNIAGVQTSDAGDYTVVFTTACGDSSSAIAVVAVNGCPSDLNGDDVVDDADFAIFIVAYNTLECASPEMPAWCPADLNGDGLVDDGDFSVFVVGYGEFVCE